MKENFVVVMSFDNSVFWGKVGPFNEPKEASDWAKSFRAASRKINLDMTALTGDDFSQVVANVDSKKYLPSRDVEEIMKEASIQWLLGKLG